MFKIGDCFYSLRFTNRVVEQLEAILGENVAVYFVGCGNTPTVKTLKLFGGFSLHDDTGVRVGYTMGSVLVEDLITEMSLSFVYTEIFNSLNRDYPFTSDAEYLYLVTEFEYFKAGKKTEKTNSIVDDVLSKYQKESGFAFFFVNLGCSLAEYNDFTHSELLFIRKAWEDKVVGDSNLLRDAVLNADVNANRGKKRFKKLWKKQPKVDSNIKGKKDIATRITELFGVSIL